MTYEICVKMLPNKTEAFKIKYEIMDKFKIDEANIKIIHHHNK